LENAALAISSLVVPVRVADVCGADAVYKTEEALEAAFGNKLVERWAGVTGDCTSYSDLTQSYIDNVVNLMLEKKTTICGAYTSSTALSSPDFGSSGAEILFEYLKTSARADDDIFADVQISAAYPTRTVAQVRDCFVAIAASKPSPTLTTNKVCDIATVPLFSTYRYWIDLETPASTPPICSSPVISRKDFIEYVSSYIWDHKHSTVCRNVYKFPMTGPFLQTMETNKNLRQYLLYRIAKIPNSQCYSDLITVSSSTVLQISDICSTADFPDTMAVHGALRRAVRNFATPNTCTDGSETMPKLLWEMAKIYSTYRETDLAFCPEFEPIIADWSLNDKVMSQFESGSKKLKFILAEIRTDAQGRSCFGDLGPVLARDPELTQPMSILCNLQVGESKLSGFNRLAATLNQLSKSVGVPQSCGGLSDVVTSFFSTVATRLMKGPASTVCGKTLFRADHRLSINKLVSDDLTAWSFASSKAQSFKEIACLANFALELSTVTVTEPTLTAFCDTRTYSASAFVYNRLLKDLSKPTWSSQSSIACSGLNIDSKKFFIRLGEFLLELKESSAVCGLPPLPPLSSSSIILSLFKTAASPSGDYLPHLLASVLEGSKKTCLEDLATSVSSVDVDIPLSAVCGFTPTYSNRAQLTAAIKAGLEAVKTVMIPDSCSTYSASIYQEYSSLVSAFVFGNKKLFC
jgi:hypothetical protein